MGEQISEDTDQEPMVCKHEWMACKWRYSGVTTKSFANGGVSIAYEPKSKELKTVMCKYCLETKSIVKENNYY
jgi:hypothetical protein